LPLWIDRHGFGTVRLQTRAEVTGSVGREMDEARAVLHRLERIEALEREGAPARSLLAEVHALLAEAEIWVAAERDGTDLAEQALLRCRDAVDARGRQKQTVEAVPG
jgi:hypothetical protein